MVGCSRSSRYFQNSRQTSFSKCLNGECSSFLQSFMSSSDFFFFFARALELTPSHDFQTLDGFSCATNVISCITVNQETISLMTIAC